MQESFPREVSALGAVFAALEVFVRREAVDADTGRDLAVIVEELFTNQVRHARPGTGRIGLGFARDGDSVVVELVDDDVDAFDPAELPEVDVSGPAVERQPGGLGLHLVRNLSDAFDWDYDPARRRCRIRVTRRLKG